MIVIYLYQLMPYSMEYFMFVIGSYWYTRLKGPIILRDNVIIFLYIQSHFHLLIKYPRVRFMFNFDFFHAMLDNLHRIDFIRWYAYKKDPLSIHSLECVYNYM